MLLVDEEFPWIWLVKRVVACEGNFNKKIRKFDEKSSKIFTRLIQPVERASLRQVPVPEHHASLDGLHLARCQRLCLMIIVSLIVGVISKLKKREKKKKLQNDCSGQGVESTD